MSTPELQAETLPAWAPTVATVAGLIRARTKDGNGNELGTFTPATRPTDAQATEAIEHAVIGLGEKVGEMSPKCEKTARLCSAYGAAAEIELSYFPEQARTDRSPYQFLIARYDALLTGVEQCVLNNLPGYAPGGTSTGIRSGTLLAMSAATHDFYMGKVGVLELGSPGMEGGEAGEDKPGVEPEHPLP
jgi:hypothetical protein